jgi:hypothetical protein
MTTLPEPQLDWTEHYVKYGFTVVRGVLDRDYIDAALDEVRRMIGNGLPLEEWTVDNVPQRFQNIDGGNHMPTLQRVYEQPRVRAAIDALFGSSAEFNGDRHFKLFVKPFDPAAKPQLTTKGHIDFVHSPIPALGSGFLFQVSLVDKEPFGGNITIWPGTHTRVQRHVMHDPDWQYPKNFSDIPDAEPFEFVPRAGDVLFFHHLVCHEGNPCCTRMPRISLHCQANRDEWFNEIDPADATLSPWARSLTLNGPYRTRCDERKMMLDFWSRPKIDKATM